MDHGHDDAAPGQPSRWMDIHLDTSSMPEDGTQDAPSSPAPIVANTKTSPLPEDAPKHHSRRGPRPITNQPTKRFEGKAYPSQIVQLAQLETRLTMEGKSVPATERRRITLNTFVRMGLDIVLAHADNLTGANEDQLLESLRRSIASNPTARSSKK